MLVSGSFLSNSISAKEAINMFDKSNIDFIHVDIMDGKFTENKSYTISEVTKYSTYTSKPLDVHLMVNNPDKYIDSLSMLNTRYITFHFETQKDSMKIIDHIKNNGIKCGISIKPSTSPKEILDLLPYLDLVLIMSVEPGKSGQTFMESVLYKVDILKKYIEENNLNTIISIDGGVNETNIPLLKEKKIDMVVSSSYLLSGDINNKVNFIKEV